MINNQSPAIDSPQKVGDGQEEKTLIPSVTGDAAMLPQQAQIDEPPATRGTPYDNMRKSIRAWGWWSLGWSVFSVFGSNMPWAVVLVTIGLMSFYFYDVSAVFLVYAGVLLWAALWNLLVSGEVGWVIMGVIQVVCTGFAFRVYRRFRNAKANHNAKLLAQAPSSSSSGNRESRMAWLALFLGTFSLVGLCGFIPAGLALYDLDSAAAERLIGAVFDVIFDLGVLGIPVGIAAFSAGCRSKAAAAGGIALGVLSALVLIISVAMVAGG
jgi:hypothetical protein